MTLGLERLGLFCKSADNPAKFSPKSELQRLAAIAALTLRLGQFGLFRKSTDNPAKFKPKSGLQRLAAAAAEADHVETEMVGITVAV